MTIGPLCGTEGPSPLGEQTPKASLAHLKKKGGSREFPCGLLNCIQREHSGVNVVVDVAVVEPRARIVRDHGQRLHAAGEHFDHVYAHLCEEQTIAVPVRTVKVNFRSHRYDVPSNSFAKVHYKSG